MLLRTAMVASLLSPALTPVIAQTSTPDLMHLFQNPPADSKPMVRWWWFGTAVTKPEILHELQQMKANGIGGAELAFVYPEVVDSPEHKNLPFLSPEMLDCVHYAETEARKLGLRVDVTMGSGWPYGGPSTTLEEAATRLRTVEVAIPSNMREIQPPKLAEGESFLSAAIVTGPLTPHTLPAPPPTWDGTSAMALPKPNPLESVHFAPVPQPRVALFFIQSHTGQQVKRAAVGAEGFVLDPFSHQAVAHHLQTVGEPLLKAFGPTPPYAVFSDSLEAYGADWTPTLPAEFQKRRGYDLLPHLPEIVAGGTPAAEKVRHDYGVTLTELVNENYITQINRWATSHDTKFRSQTYGEPAVSFSSQNLAALPEGEGPQWRAFSTLRWATSANHVFGNNVTSGETFTWLHSPVFRATPLDMKAEADIDFIMGENQLIFHGWPYSPPASQLPPGDPGWSLYAAGVFNDHNPWHPVMPAVDAYITRLSALLRQGQPANQVAILLPTDDAWASFVPGKVTVTGAMQKLMPKEIIAAILSSGYNFDFIDAEAIDKVGLGTHQILVIPPTERIPGSTVKRIQSFTTAGGKVIAVGHMPTLDPEGQPLTYLSSLQASATLVPDLAGLPKALRAAQTPDLQYQDGRVGIPDQLGFIRRKLPDADIYFIANTGNTPVNIGAWVATKYPVGDILDPETGHRTAAALSRNLNLDLAPYESRTFIFSASAQKPSAQGGILGGGPPTPGAIDLDWNSGWAVDFTGLRKSTANLPSDWSADPVTLHFSGEAVFSRDFSLAQVPPLPVFLRIDGGKPLPGAPNSPPEHAALGTDGLPNPLVTRTGPGMHAFYDPPIREAALVTINGQPAGALWHPPYTLDVSKLLKPGPNHIEIHVFNTALNAWSGIPPHDYKPLIAKYGDRFQMQDLDKVQPLPSGILGTVHLVTEAPGK